MAKRILKCMRACLVTALLMLSVFFVQSASATRVISDVWWSQDERGIRVVFNDVELYFNASHGGEITEYFDLRVDPSRSRNLVNLECMNGVFPLFASLLLDFEDHLYSSGRDRKGRLWSIGNSSQYLILQSSSRIMNIWGDFIKDAYGNPVRLSSTWIIRSSGLVSVERTFYVPTHATVSPEWRWYPFLVSRRAGFEGDATFYMFNTTYAYANASYPGYFPVLPSDARGVFGVAVPFSNTSLGGDGTHNILVAYKHDELLDVDEWRSDNYHSVEDDILQSGACTNKFSEEVNFLSHVYHMVVNFTHQPIDEGSVPDFAKFYADDTSIALLMECSVASDKDVYKPGDQYAFYGSGISYYNLNGITARLTVEDSLNRTVGRSDYGPRDIKAGQSFNGTLREGTFPLDAVLGNYTVSLTIFSSNRIPIASGSKVITISES